MLAASEHPSGSVPAPLLCEDQARSDYDYDYIVASGIPWGLLSRAASSGMVQKERNSNLVWPEASASDFPRVMRGSWDPWTAPTVMQQCFLGCYQSQIQGSATPAWSPEMGDV